MLFSLSIVICVLSFQFSFFFSSSLFPDSIKHPFISAALCTFGCMARYMVTTFYSIQSHPSTTQFLNVCSVLSIIQSVPLETHPALSHTEMHKHRCYKCMHLRCLSQGGVTTSLTTSKLETLITSSTI